MKSLAIYAKAQDARTMDQQVQACREFAQAKGFAITAVFTDNPTGRGKEKVRNPEFQQLLAGLKAKKFDGVIAYSVDRVARDPRDLEDLIDVLHETGAIAETVTGNLRLDTPTDITVARMMASVMVTIANQESAENHRSRRTLRGIQRAKEARA